MTHILKTWPVYFDAVRDGLKNFEVRRDDRGFQKGDFVELRRTRPDSLHTVEFGYDGKPMYVQTFKIGWILTGGQVGIEPGYIVFSLERP